MTRFVINPDEAMKLLEIAALIERLRAENEALRVRLGEVRICVACGQIAPTDQNRADPFPGCLSPDACTWDLTPQEAVDHWRAECKRREDVIDGLRLDVERLTKERADLPPSWLANCCVCGRVVDTREPEDGGDSHGAQIDGDLWVCSSACWDATGKPVSAPHERPDLDALLEAARVQGMRDAAEIAEYWAAHLNREHPENRVALVYMKRAVSAITTTADAMEKGPDHD